MYVCVYVCVCVHAKYTGLHGQTPPVTERQAVEPSGPDKARAVLEGSIRGPGPEPGLGGGWRRAGTDRGRGIRDRTGSGYPGRLFRWPEATAGCKAWFVPDTGGVQCG